MTKSELRRAMRTLNRGCGGRTSGPRPRCSAIVERVESLPVICAGPHRGTLTARCPTSPTCQEALRPLARRRSAWRCRGSRATTMRLFDYDPRTLLSAAPSAFSNRGRAARLCPPGEIDLLLDPRRGLYPAGGRRCGRGRGYYDQLSLAARVPGREDRHLLCPPAGRRPARRAARRPHGPACDGSLRREADPE